MKKKLMILMAPYPFLLPLLLILLVAGAMGGGSTVGASVIDGAT
ncbi:CHAP domain-containing protein, partial [Streptococcus dysgalactiae]